MPILMVYLEIKFGPFSDFGGSNSKIVLEVKLEDKFYLEKDLSKDPKKEQPSSTGITPS